MKLPSLPKIQRKDIITDDTKAVVLIYDKDLKARKGFEKLPISSDGQRIDITQGGKGHFKPEINPKTHIDVARKGRFRRWRTYWTRIFIVPKGAKECVDFSTPKVTGPTEQEVMNAAGSELVTGFGTQKQDTPLIDYLMLGGIALILLYLFGVI